MPNVFNPFHPLAHSPSPGGAAPLPLVPGPAVTTEQASPTTVYTYQRVYSLDEGLMRLVPAAADGTAARFAKMKAQAGMLQISWTAQRLGTQPVIPSYAPSDTNEVLLDRTFTPCAVAVLPDGNFVFTITGVYTYGLKVLPDLTKLKGGVPPWSTARPAQNVYDVTKGQKVV